MRVRRLSEPGAREHPTQVVPGHPAATALGANTKRFLKVPSRMVALVGLRRGGSGSPFIALLGRIVMYGTRFRRRGVSRPESTLGGRRRRLLLRPAAYAILAAAVCLAAATLPSGGKSDHGQGSSRAGRQRFHRHPRRPGLHPQADQDRRAPLARVPGQSRCGDSGQSRSDRRPGLLPVAGRPRLGTRSRTGSPATACARSMDRATTCSRAATSSRPRTSRSRA